jgi:drug/metabolite transporter (DMT)-like permease
MAQPLPSPSASDNRGAILSMIASMGFFSLNDMTMKLLSASAPTGQTIVTRTAFALVFIVLATRLRGERFPLAQMRRPLLLARAACEMAIVALFVSSLRSLKLGDATAINQATPLMITGLAPLALKETVGWRRWAAALVGFFGVVLVARPGADGVNPWALVALAVAAVVATRDIITRFIPADVPTASLTLMSAIAGGLGGLALAPFEHWVAPSAAQIGLAAFAAAMTTAGNLFIILAFRRGEVSAVSPFRYAVIPFSLLWGFLAFGERPDAVALAGIGLIVAAGLYTLHRERALRQAARGASP